MINLSSLNAAKRFEVCQVQVFVYISKRFGLCWCFIMMKYASLTKSLTKIINPYGHEINS